MADYLFGQAKASSNRLAARESPLVLAIDCWNLRALSRYIELFSTSSTSVDRWETVSFSNEATTPVWWASLILMSNTERLDGLTKGNFALTRCTSCGETQLIVTRLVAR